MAGEVTNFIEELTANLTINRRERSRMLYEKGLADEVRGTHEFLKERVVKSLASTDYRKTMSKDLLGVYLQFTVKRLFLRKDSHILFEKGVREFIIAKKLTYREYSGLINGLNKYKLKNRGALLHYLTMLTAITYLQESESPRKVSEAIMMCGISTFEMNEAKFREYTTRMYHNMVLERLPKALEDNELLNDLHLTLVLNVKSRFDLFTTAKEACLVINPVTI